MLVGCNVDHSLALGYSTRLLLSFYTFFTPCFIIIKHSIFLYALKQIFDARIFMKKRKRHMEWKSNCSNDFLFLFFCTNRIMNENALIFI